MSKLNRLVQSSVMRLAFMALLGLLALQATSTAHASTENYETNPGGAMAAYYEAYKIGQYAPGPNPGTYGDFSYAYRNAARALVHDVFWYNDSGVGNSGVLATDTALGGSGREFDISRNGGGRFSFQSLSLMTFTTSTNVIFRGFRNGSQIYVSGDVWVNALLDGYSSASYTTYTPSTAWSDIDELRIVVKNSSIVFDPLIDNFIYTLGTPPTVTSNAATSVGLDAATLNGTVNANGDSATVTFYYGTTVTYGSSITATQSPVTGFIDTAVSASLSGLSCHTAYHFRVSGTNIAGTTNGGDQSFTTSPCPVFYAVTYNDNGATSGAAPTDGNAYSSGDTVTVLGNTGSLVKTGSTFVGWNLASNGSGTHYAVGSSYTITSNTTLYAQWLGIVSATAASAVTQSGFTANWGSAAGATGYRLDVATDSGFTSFVSGYNDLDVGNTTSWVLAGLAPGTSYFYRLRSTSATLTAANSNTISLTTQTGRVSGIVVDPGAPATLYAAVDGGGVFTSSNSGASWSAAAGQPASNRVQKLLLVAGAPTTLYAATYGSGIFYSINSATSWSACTSQPTNPNVLTLSATASGTLYAGTEGGVFASLDGCASWSPVNGGLTVDAAKPPLAIAVDPNAAGTLYAGFDGAGVYKSINSGGAWTAASTQPANLRVKVLVIKPGDSSKLFAATYGGGVFQSTDSGQNWNVACATQPANLNLLSLAVDAAGKLYAGSEAGVFVSSNDCANWTALNTGMP